MKPAIFGLFANSIAFPDLRWTSDEGLSLGRIRIELLSGLTVALALVPEAVAFAFVAGVHPLVGLYAAFLVGLVTAIFGGRPGMISGATGALAVVMVALVSQHGVEYLFATVVLMGLLQIFAGAMSWGKFIRRVPHQDLPTEFKNRHQNKEHDWSSYSKLNRCCTTSGFFILKLHLRLLF